MKVTRTIVARIQWTAKSLMQVWGKTPDEFRPIQE